VQYKRFIIFTFNADSHRNKVTVSDSDRRWHAYGLGLMDSFSTRQLSRHDM